jgi:hypothetical protein
MQETGVVAVWCLPVHGDNCNSNSTAGFGGMHMHHPLVSSMLPSSMLLLLLFSAL